MSIKIATKSPEFIQSASSLKKPAPLVLWRPDSSLGIFPFLVFQRCVRGISLKNSREITARIKPQFHCDLRHIFIFKEQGFGVFDFLQIDKISRGSSHLGFEFVLEL